MIYEEHKNKIFINILCTVLFLNVFLNFLIPLVRVYFGFSSTSLLTIALYLIMLMYFIYIGYKFKVYNLFKLFIYFLIMFIFIINYLYFENARMYLISENMILIYVFFIPISIFFVSNIKNWNDLFEISRKYSKAAIILSTLVLILNLNSELNYMEFSYGILPFICIMLIDCLESYKFSKLIYLVCGLLVLLLFSARSPLLFLIMLLIYWLLTNLSKLKGFITTVVIISFILLVIFNADSLFLYISNINSEMNSYVLSNLLNGDFFNSDTRIIIYEESKRIISNMGFHMYGLFGDRNLTSGVYSHNIIYEVLISFGWILGSIFLFLIVFIILSAYFLEKNEKLILALFSFSLFARYFISGSFVMEQMFYMYIAIAISFILSNITVRITRYDK